MKKEQTIDQTKQKNRFGKQENMYRITPSQAAALIASTIIGVSVLTLPRTMTDAGHQFGWISILFGLALSMGAVFTIFKLGQRFPGQTLVEYTRKILGSRRSKWTGRIISFPLLVFYILFWGVTTAMVARIFGEVVVTAVLVNTPLEVIVSTMLLLCFVLSVYEGEVVARVNEVLLLLIVVPVLFISFSAYQNARLEFIMPLIPPANHWSGLLKGTLPAMTSFLGFEILLMFNEHVARDKHMLRDQMVGILIPGVLYLLIVIAGIMAFGFEELSKQAWPTLELIKSVNVPGLILERMEAVFLGVWVAAVFTTAGNWFYCMNWTFAQTFGIRKYRFTSAFLIVGIYFVAMKPRNIQELFHLLDLVGYFGVAASFLLPLVLLLIAIVRKLDDRKKGGTEEDSQHVAEAG